MIKDLILKNRSYRRFHQNTPVEMETLVDLIDLARLSPSAKNAQPLKYFLSNDEGTNATIFEELAWAGYYKDWNGPAPGERPAAYIIILNDTKISSDYFCDHGIVSQSILLGAVEKQLGGCIIGSVNKLKLHRELELEPHLKIVHVIALGEPKEEVKLEEMLNNNQVYWKDFEQVHHVPKRELKDIILKK